MDLYVFDSNRQMSGVIESYEYLRWTRRYSRCGGFELKAVATDSNIALLQIGSILWKTDDEEAGLIESVELTLREQEFITVSGRFAIGLLARRIVWFTEVLSGDLADGIGQLLNNHLIAPADPTRKMNGVTYIPAETGIHISTQISFKNLMTAVGELCEAADVGIKTVFDPANGFFAVSLYIGSQTQAVFSREYENIMEQEFTRSAADYANIALIGGEGDGADRIFATLGDASGENRYEIFVDAKDLRSENFPDDYTAALLFRGNSRLAGLAMVQAFEASINQYGNLVYKTDFDVGSKVQLVSKRWGVSMSARITEIEESYDRDGMNLGVTFGRPQLTLAQKLKGGDA